MFVDCAVKKFAVQLVRPHTFATANIDFAAATESALRSDFTFSAANTGISCPVANTSLHGYKLASAINSTSHGNKPASCFCSFLTVVAVSSRARILGECLTIHSLPRAFLFFFIF